MIVLNPTPETDAAPARMAPALERLEGRVVGLLDNGKFNVVHFFDHAERILRAEYAVKDVVRQRRPGTRTPPRGRSCWPTCSPATP
ncbi:MAG: hypothetical protein U0531_16465 [Dehalococcoidia bacterium]